MAKRRDGAVREAQRRQARAAEPAPRRATLRDLEAVRDEIAALDERRALLLGRRDVLVQELRSGGATWRALEDAAGTTRPALLKRGAGGLL